MKDNTLKIFIDTNFILHAIDWNLNFTHILERNITKPYQIMIHPLVIEELDLLESQSSNSTKLLSKIKLARELILSNFMIYNKSIEGEGTDVSLLLAAEHEEGAVMTFDSNLRKRCKERGIPTITLTKRKEFISDGYLEVN